MRPERFFWVNAAAPHSSIYKYFHPHCCCVHFGGVHPLESYLGAREIIAALKAYLDERAAVAVCVAQKKEIFIKILFPLLTVTCSSLARREEKKATIAGPELRYISTCSTLDCGAVLPPNQVASSPS